MSKSNHSQVISSLIWKLLERISTQGIQFIVQIVLARLLFPEDYGLIAIIAIFINFANLLIQNGFNTSLIQKKNTDELDYSSVFYLSITISIIMYIILFNAAPYVSVFYKDYRLTKLLRVLSLNLFIGAFSSIQIALISKRMQFKLLFRSSLLGVLVSGVLGIAAALLDLGVWALVIQQISNQFVNVVVLWFSIKWKPIIAFSFERVKSLFSFGWKVLVSSMIYNLYNDIRTLLVGRMYSTQQLGYYNRGAQFPELIVNNIDGSIQSVMLPVFSRNQDDTEQLKRMMKKSIVLSAYIVFPLMAGLFATADNVVKILLTDKWIKSIPFIRIFSISYALRPIHTANQQAVNSMGRSDISLKLNIIKRICDFVILFITLNHGVIAIAIGGIISSVIGSIVNAYPNRKLLKYSYFEQIMDIIPALFMSFVMGLQVYSVNWLGLGNLATLALQVVSGIFTYILLSISSKNESFNYIIKIARGYMR